MKIYENASREYTKDEIISEFLQRTYDLLDAAPNDNETIAHALLGFIDGRHSELATFAIESKEVEGDFGGSLAGNLYYSSDELQKKVEEGFITPQCRDFIIKIQEMVHTYPKDTLVIKILEELDENYIVYPIATEDDKQYHIENEENYYPLKKERVNICGELASTYKKLFWKKNR